LSLLADLERLTHISGHQSVSGRAQDREIRRSKSDVPYQCATQPIRINAEDKVNDSDSAEKDQQIN